MCLLVWLQFGIKLGIQPAIYFKWLLSCDKDSHSYQISEALGKEQGGFQCEEGLPWPGRAAPEGPARSRSEVADGEPLGLCSSEPQAGPLERKQGHPATHSRRRPGGLHGDHLLLLPGVLWSLGLASWGRTRGRQAARTLPASPGDWWHLRLPAASTSPVSRGKMKSCP